MQTYPISTNFSRVWQNPSMTAEVRKTETGVPSDSANLQSDWRDVRTGRFLPGNKASPGRPKNGSRVSDYIETYGVATNRQIAAALAKGARKGSIRHIETVLAYQSGLPLKRVQVSSDGPLAGILGDLVAPDNAPDIASLPSVDAQVRELGPGE